ncbi:hypothetical protein ACLKA6_002309 [Drosophila palustris]
MAGDNFTDDLENTVVENPHSNDAATTSQDMRSSTTVNRLAVKVLKRNIIERFCESEQKKIQKLLSDIDLGDRRPTQLLNELRGLAKDRINEDFLKSLWRQRLPPHARAILQA